MNLISYLQLFFIFLFASAFFSGAETALFSLSKIERHHFKLSKSLAARRVVEMLSKPRETLVVILMGNTFANVAFSVVGASVLAYFLKKDVETDSIVSVAVLTPILLICGEVFPKNVAIHFAKFLAPMVVFPLLIFSRIIWPIRVVLTWFVDKAALLFGGSAKKAPPYVMEEEFRKLIDLGKVEGILDEEEGELIHNVFEFSDKVVFEVMTSKGKLFSLPVDIPYDEMLSKISKSRFSRIPVFEFNFDNVIGVLHVRDLFAFEEEKRKKGVDDIHPWLRKPLFVKPDDSLYRVLKLFQMTRLHMALVRDDDKIIGVITMKDILDELFEGKGEKIKK